jgi:hypothetical protein
MPKVRASSGTMGTTCLPRPLSLQQLGQDAHEGHRGADLAAVGALGELGEERVAGVFSAGTWPALGR